MPLSTTKTDFWRLVEEHDVHTIVMMNNESEAKVSVVQPNMYVTQLLSVRVDVFIISSDRFIAPRYTFVTITTS